MERSIYSKEPRQISSRKCTTWSAPVKSPTLTPVTATAKPSNGHAFRRENSWTGHVRKLSPKTTAIYNLPPAVSSLRFYERFLQNLGQSWALSHLRIEKSRLIGRGVFTSKKNPPYRKKRRIYNAVADPFTEKKSVSWAAATQANIKCTSKVPTTKGPTASKLQAINTYET